MPRTTDESDDHSSSLLCLRTALILLSAVLAGIGAAVLAWLAGRHLAEAVLLGIGAAAAATAYFNRVIGTR